MKIVKTVNEMKSLSHGLIRKGKTIGLVPTMGFLHKGHLSLVKEARKRCDYLVVSIFVNPTQFGPKEDLKKYPHDFKRDSKLLANYGVDAIFYPKSSDIYPKSYRTYVEVEELSEKLCGKSRPIHFRGVSTIVLKLFNIVKPDIAVFGEKDFQQQVIIKKMIEDLNMDVEIISLPTIREADGVAMSSRNTYLNPSQRKSSIVLHRALQLGKILIKSGEKKPTKIKSAMQKLIAKQPSVKIDYISICDPETLDNLGKINGKTLVAIAAQVGKARLIDNIVVSPGKRK